MEEQRQRQEDEARRAAVASAAEAGISSPAADGEEKVHQLAIIDADFCPSSLSKCSVAPMCVQTAYCACVCCRV